MSKKKGRKKRFELQPNETIDQCIERINKEGYTPIRRVEEPIFQEIEENGEKVYQAVSRTVIFDAIPSKTER